MNGLSQEQLAEKINISVTHMSHIENGSTKLSLPVLVDFAEVFKISIDEIIFGNTNYEKDKVIDEIALILKNCTPEETMVIVDVVKSTKYAMDKYL